jgi:hypothetical protein
LRCSSISLDLINAGLEAPQVGRDLEEVAAQAKCLPEEFLADAGHRHAFHHAEAILQGGHGFLRVLQHDPKEGLGTLRGDRIGASDR